MMGGLSPLEFSWDTEGVMALVVVYFVEIIGSIETILLQ
jgi:hypothetical protein